MLVLVSLALFIWYSFEFYTKAAIAHLKGTGCITSEKWKLYVKLSPWLSFKKCCFHEGKLEWKTSPSWVSSHLKIILEHRMNKWMRLLNLNHYRLYWYMNLHPCLLRFDSKQRYKNKLHCSLPRIIYMYIELCSIFAKMVSSSRSYNLYVWENSKQ